MSVETFDKGQVTNQLKLSICNITFEKKDGTIRNMKCTLNHEMIPTTELDENRIKRTRIENPDVLPVYDVEAQAWRSFRWDSLLTFNMDQTE